MKFTKAFTGVADGDVYATEFKKGQDCPKELEAAASEAGATHANASSQVQAGEYPPPQPAQAAVDAQANN